MILINPRGKEVEFSDKKAEKLMSLKLKVKQGWKRLIEKKPINKNSLYNLKQNKPVVKKPKVNKK